MKLQQFFEAHPKGAVAFSGGVDSSLLVWAAKEYGSHWKAYYIHTAFQPAFELADAKAVARQCGMELTVIEADILGNEQVVKNPGNRCYYCKQALFGLILKRAEADGFSLVIDGTNASDDASDRPGMKALRELSVRSPLRECGLTKAEVRKRCREAGLPTWDKPSYACLATRIPTGTVITKEALREVEQAEDFLRGLGFTDFRVRLDGVRKIIQVPAQQMEQVLKLRTEVMERLGNAVLDLQPRNTD